MSSIKNTFKEKFLEFRNEKIHNFSTRINRAHQLATFAHHGQKRASGDLYMTHPVAIMNYLQAMECDEETLLAALLHDVLEDTTITIQDLEELFNREIAYIVYFLSKDLKEYFIDPDKRRILYFQKLQAGFYLNYKVYLIKLVDRLHNLSTIGHFSKIKQQKSIKETMTVFLPLFRKNLHIVPDKYQLQCQKILKDLDEIIVDFFVK